MEVQPVVLGQQAIQHLVVIADVVGYFSVGEYKCHGIVPRLRGLGRIDCYAGIFFQLHHVVIEGRTSDFRNDPVGVGVGDDLIADSPDHKLVLDGGMIFAHEASASVVEQPVDLHVRFQDPIRDPICLQVVGLPFVHRNKDVVRAANSRKNDQSEQKNGSHAQIDCVESKLSNDAALTYKTS